MGENAAEKSSIGKNTILYAAAQIISKTASYLLLPIYTYYISTKELGMYEYIRSYIAVLTVFSGLGFSTYYLRQYAFEKNNKLFSGSVYWFLAMWNVILLVLGMIIIPVAMKVLNAPVDFFPLMFLALIYQFLYSFELIPMRTYRIRGEVKQYLIICITKSVIQVIMIFSLVRYFALGIKGRYLSEITVSFVLAIIFVIYMLKNSEHTVDREIIKNGLSFSLPLVPTELLQIFSTSVTAILIEKFLSLEQLGIYSISISITAVVDVINNSLWYAVEPEIYVRAASNDFNEFFVKIKKYYLTVVCSVCAGVGLLIKEGVQLVISSAYADSWQIVQVIAFSYITAGVASLYNQLVVIESKTKQLIWINLIKLSVIIAMCWVLLPVLQVKILGWTYFAGYVIILVFYLMVITRNRDREKELIKDICVIILSGLFIFISRLLPEMNILYSMMFKCLLWIILFISILWIYKINFRDLISFVRKK